MESLQSMHQFRTIRTTLITRRILAVAAVMLMAVMLAACGGTPAPTATTAPTSAPTTAPEATDTEAPAEPTEAPTAETAEEANQTEEAPVEEPAAETEDAGEAAAIEGPYVTIANVTSVRSGPGTSFEIVAQVDVNEIFPVVAQTGSGLTLWYLITMPDGEPAWVWSRVIVLTPADAEIEPAATVPASGG